MACNTDDNASSIALLRRIRAGEHVEFVHGVDVCDAAPEILVANLEPVPGYSSVWYLYCAKKYTNKRGKLSGYRQRAITGGGGASWHPEIGRKNVQGSGGGTFCTFTYGRKHKTEEGSARSAVVVDRMGWRMVEYDDLAVAADGASNYVLCKVYRTALAKGNSSLPSSSSASGQNQNASSSKPPTAKKRKARGGDHPEAPPATLIRTQETVYYSYQPQVVQEVGVQQAAGPYAAESEHGHGHGHGGGFDFNSIEEVNANEYMDILAEMLRDEPDHPEAPPASLIVQQQVQQEEDVQQAAGPSYAAESEHGHGHGGGYFNDVEEFDADYYMDVLEMLRDEPDPEPGMQQPTTVAEPEHDDGRSIQLPRMCSYTPSGVHTSATKMQRSGLLQGPDDAHSLLL